MKYDYKEIKKLPDTFSLEDLRVVCHISKRTARFYLQTGLIACHNNGKKTHCYTIRKEDLIDALHRYEKDPNPFIISKNFENQYARPFSSVNYLPPDDVNSVVAQEFYKKKLAHIPDILCITDVAKITGYYTTAVHRWCRSGKLKALRSQPRTWISKKSLYAFLLSDDYNNIAQKSENHRMDIADIFKKIHHGG